MNSMSMHPVEPTMMAKRIDMAIKVLVERDPGLTVSEPMYSYLP